MCGITGFINLTNNKKESYEETLNKMTSSIIHRGPDAQGSWYDENKHIGLGHVRLSIIDLSEAGAQPMKSHCGRYVFIYNGEIYNYKDIKSKIESEFGKIEWKGNSDTEVVLYAFSIWGVKKTLEQCNGMYAFALWDKKEEKLTLGRDRMGQKPLYYGFVDNHFVFGSELKSLKQHPSWKGVIDTESLDIYLRTGYVPTPYSIYEGVNKLLPSTFLEICKEDIANKKLKDPIEYWSIKHIYEKGKSPNISLSNNLKNVESILTDAIEKRSISDVPLGAFLSGGYDSSLIVALMQKNSESKVNTFSIGFHEDKFNEAQYAKQVAKILGTNHTEFYLNSKDAMNIIPSMSEHYDEPFADSSQIPTFLVSKMAREKVTVCLSGDAGDELFGGYNRYNLFPKRWEEIQKYPRFISNSVDSLLDKTNLPFSSSIGKKITRLSKILKAKDRYQFYLESISEINNPSSLLINKKASKSFFSDPNVLVNLDSFKEEMMYLDLRTFVLDDILVKIDRASMANSLEVRNPFLDHRLIEYAAGLPLDYKIKDGQSKWILRQILYQYVPKSIMERPKAGFMVPISDWLKNEYRDWAGDLLNESSLRKQGIFDVDKVRSLYKLHNNGGNVSGALMWHLISFQSWYNNQ